MHAVEWRVVHGDVAFGRRLQASEYTQQAGFADAAGAEQADRFAGSQCEIESLDRGARLAGVSQRDVACLQHWRFKRRCVVA